MKIATVISDGLNVRINPHKDAKIITALSKGDNAPVLDHKSFGGFTWLKIELEDKRVGWVYSPYVVVKSRVPDHGPPHIPVPDAPPEVWFYVKLAGLGAAMIGIAVMVAKCG